MKKIVSLIVLLILCVGNISVIAESDNRLKDTVLERITESSVILQAGLDEAIVYGKKIKLEKTLDVEKNTTKLSHDFLEQYFGQNVDSLEGLTNKNVYENNGLYIISEKEINKTQIDQYYYKLCMLFGVFVDTQSKRGNGTIAKPFSNIEDAITLIKEIEKNSGFLEGEYPVYLRQGNYQICKTYKFDDISIPEGTNVVFRPYKNEKVILSGGVNFYGKDFETITENDILEKLPNDSKGKVYRINLSSYGLSDFGDKVLDTSANPSEMNLIYNGQTMNVARWPNQGTVKTGKMLVVNGSDGTPGFEFVFDNPRIAKWVSAKNPWIWGTFEWEWFAESLQVKNIDLSKNSIRTVNNHRFTPAENRNWYIYNLLEELDEAGEYYFDKSTGYLYFYPGIDDVKNGTFREAQLCLSTLNENMIELNKCKNIEFRNVIFENAGSNMIVMNDCDNVIVSGCVIRNCGNTAIDAENVSNVKIVGCDIYNIGGKGVFLTGGNRDDFTPGNNEILNCRIYKFGQTVRTYASGISLQGCGNRAAHNELFDFPHTAISNSYSNNNIFEYNEIHDGLTDGANDAGVVYVSVDPTAFGNILRNNYFHDIYAGIGTIYLDDATAGYTVENNLFYNVSRSVFMHGANYSKIVGNVTLNTNQDSIAVTVMSHDTRWDPKTLTPAAGSTSKSTDYMNCAKRVPFTSEIWKKTYPQVEDVISWGIAQEPLNNEIHDNVTFSKNGMKTVFVNSNAHYVEEHDNPYYAEEISFDDILNKKNEVISKIPGFDKIGLDSIGIYKDEIRDSMPVIEDFNMSYPYNKQENVEAASVTFKWTDANATRKYRFILALDESFRKIVRDDIVFGTSHTVNGLRYNETRYYWKAEAISNNQLSLEEKVKPASSKYFSFTTKKAETIDYTNAENILYQAENIYKNMIEGGGPGEFFEGAKSEYAQLTEALKADLKMKNMSQRKLNNILDDFTSKENAVLSKRNQMTIRVNDMFVQEDWTFKQNTVSFSKSSFAWVKGSGDDPQVVGYSKRKLENYENFKTNVTFDLAEGTWQGISMRASSPSTVSWNGNSQYMVIVKSDVIEFQKYKNNKNGIYETYENKWIKSGEKYLIDFEIKNVEGVAAEITFKVNGEPIIQYTDKDDPILNSGYLQFYNASGGKTLKVEAVE